MHIGGSIYRMMGGLLVAGFLFSCEGNGDTGKKDTTAPGSGKREPSADMIISGQPGYQNKEKEAKHDRYANVSDSLTSFSIDTISLKNFWNSFQGNIRTNNKSKVIEVLEFPVHAVFLTAFQFSYDCDTARFVRDEKKYLDVDIDKNNAMKYYDFMFGGILKEMILNTSAEDLVQKGMNSSAPGIAFRFFVRDYIPKGKCYFDHSVYFYFRQIGGKHWLISISGG